MKGKIYQLHDADHQEYGLIYSEDENLTDDNIQDLWNDFFTQTPPEDDEEFEYSIDEFVEYLGKRGFSSERQYVEDVFLK
jgi:hypothetical protein